MIPLIYLILIIANQNNQRNHSSDTFKNLKKFFASRKAGGTPPCTPRQIIK
ncbi:hypothetical protein GMMP15_2110010 [Candidatus Magnetomoraceae bacterium gMMP-15]